MNDLIDDDIRIALAPYRRVTASRALRVAVTQPLSQEPAERLWIRRHPRIVVGGAAAVLTAAALVVSVLVVDRSSRIVTTGPRGLSDGQTVEFADGATVNVEELYDVANYERLKAVFAEHGAELVVIERPVAPAADGRVFSLRIPAGMTDSSDSGVIHLTAGGRVEVEVGRADPDAGTAGLNLYEVFPEVEAAVVRDDPVATGRALEQLGFQLEWQLIEAPGRGHPIDAPPPGTVVISVLGPEGRWTYIDPSLRTLYLEVGSPEVAEELGHITESPSRDEQMRPTSPAHLLAPSRSPSSGG